MSWPTSGDLLNDVAIELGLRTAESDNFFDETDQASVQLVQLHKITGRLLSKAYDWSQLQRTATITTVNGTSNYALPTDFGRVIGQTGWDRTNQLPFAGPASPQLWQRFQAITQSNVVDVFFRIMANRVYVSPTPTSTRTLAYEYQTKSWVQGWDQIFVGNAYPTADSSDNKDDLVWFDPTLFTRALRLSWLKAKGLPSDAAENEFKDVWMLETGADGAAPVLFFRSMPGMAAWNPSLPDGNWGL